MASLREMRALRENVRCGLASKGSLNEDGSESTSGSQAAILVRAQDHRTAVDSEIGVESLSSDVRSLPTRNIEGPLAAYNARGGRWHRALLLSSTHLGPVKEWVQECVERRNVVWFPTTRLWVAWPLAPGGAGLMTERSFEASFEVVDDVVWAASTRGLPGPGTIRLVSSGRLGPAVELAIAHRHWPERFANVRCTGSGAELVGSALNEGRISGGGYGDHLGVLPMTRDESTHPGGDRYEQWLLRFQNATAQAGFQKPFARQLAGALGELADNVFLHSESDSVALAAFQVAGNSVEFVVADGGVGVLNSLRQNPAHAHLTSAGQALEAIVHHSASRFAANTGHGQGIKQFLRVLAGQNGHLRFRSSDHALTLRGDLAIGVGSLEVSSKAELPGLTISVQCLLSPASDSRGAS